MEKDTKIDLRGKSEEEILEAYIKIANKTNEDQKIYEQVGNYEDAMKLYEELNKNDESKNK